MVLLFQILELKLISILLVQLKILSISQEKLNHRVLLLNLYLFFMWLLFSIYYENTYIIHIQTFIYILFSNSLILLRFELFLILRKNNRLIILMLLTKFTLFVI